MKKAVIGLSGGMDSATLLGLLLYEDYEVHCCSFYYGSKHNAYERVAVANIINYYKNRDFSVVLHTFNLEDIFKDFTSNLLKSGGDIPEGHYNDENMKLTVVPGRNMIFASIMAGLAESIGADVIALGVHAGDHAIYPDCRHEFIKVLDAAIYLSSDRKVQVLTPLIDDNKTSILKKGYWDLAVRVPYQLTRTCYKDQELSCGKCGSCRERLEAFHNIGIEDPIKYE
jgi:7-cyano-7-deazaguanine synthase